MTRINTNVSSLQAQINLSRNNADLQTALTRLSTGLRINSGKDDPAGLIASETLRSDIRATEVGISNSERANQMIATADSALGQVSSLLIDIRGLVDEAANSGAMSAAQISANQLQVDASLDAINRIAQITQFQGSRLLDGSLAFTTDGVDSTKLDSVQIDQANFGTNPTIGINVELLAQASKGSLVYNSGQTTSDVVLQVGGTEGFQAFSFDAGTSVTAMASAINLVSDATGVSATASGVIEWDANAAMSTVASYGANNDITITADTAGEAAGAYYVRYFQGGTGSSTSATITQAEVDATTGAITHGYIDVTLGASAETDAEFDDMSAGIAAATASDGTLDLATAATGAFDLTWTSDGSGANDAPIITLAQGVAAQTYSAATNTYTITNDFATGITSGAFITQINLATNGIHTFASADSVTVDAVVTDVAGDIVTQGTNGIDDAVIINAVADTGGTAGNTPVTIEFTNAAAGGFGAYDAGTNTYTVNIDNDNNEFSISNADLITRLNAIGGGVHTFNGTGGSGNANIDVRGDDWAPTTLASVAPTTAGFDADTINATAAEVIEAINAEQDVMVNAGAIVARLFTVANAAGDDGSGVVGISEVVALTGSDPGQQPDANNMLQYQALDGMRDISYVAAGQNTALSIDLTTYAPEYAHAAVIVDLGMANGTFKLEAALEGDAGNQDVAIEWGTNGGATTVASFTGGVLTIDLANDDSATVDDIMEAIGTTGDFIATLARPENAPGTVPDVGDGSGIVTATAFSGTTTDVSLTGGVVSKGVMVVNLATDANGNITTTASELIAFIEASDEQVLKDFELQIDNGGTSDGTGVLVATTTDVKFDPSGTTYADTFASGTTHAANGTTAQFTVTAKNAGSAYDGVLVRVAEDTNLAIGSGAVVYQENSKTLLITYNGDLTAEQVSYLINEDDTVGALFTAQPVGGEGTGAGLVAAGDFVKLSGGETRDVPDPTTYTPPLTAGAPMLQLIGGQDAGEDVSDAMLTFVAANYGSKSFVSVKSISGTFGVTDSTDAIADRSYGTDVSVRVNGLQAVGDGLNASLSTSSLQMQIGIDVNMLEGATTSFSITGGGAQFQLGPDVVSNQQARIGIMSVSSTTLGGINNHGRLFEIRSGENYDLLTDTTGAAAIVQDVITQVTGLRGRLGAFQKTTLETNIASLQDTLETLTAAQSSIRDADFAAESSALTRAQILVQSGTRVLGIANQQPQNVLSLLQ